MKKNSTAIFFTVFILTFGAFDSLNYKAEAALSTVKKQITTIGQASLSNSSLALNKAIINYMSVEANRKSVLKKTLSYNNNSYTNTCVYFTSEILRRVNVGIPVQVCNTRQLDSKLASLGFKKSTDYKQLQPGDICFTTNSGIGYPTHVYVFAGWVKKGDYKYAWIYDNQANKYGTVFHIRNISKPDTYKGERKEALQYFRRK